ncbi:hypothetical protein J2T61_000792 [Methanocalculus sp. AMF5]|nr:hypothetical protein [Methanocalculus sp. AMF5]
MTMEGRNRTENGAIPGLELRLREVGESLRRGVYGFE